MGKQTKPISPLAKYDDGGAALIGIDSCPIEGFNYAEVNGILAQTGVYDTDKYAVSVAVTFGYRAKDIRLKGRKSLNEIVHWIE